MAFLAEATRFCNDRLWGTLSAIVIARGAAGGSGDRVALEKAIVALRYGAVAINQWPAVVYALASPPWGGHPSGSLADVQSGIGFVHNTMLGRIDKAVLRAPLAASPKPACVCHDPTAGRAGPDLVALEADPRWTRLPRVMRRLL